MNELSIGLYISAAAFDVTAAAVAVRDVIHRVREIKNFKIPVGKSITLMWNTHPDVVQQIVDAMGPVEMERRRREAENELSTRVEDEVRVREEAIARVAALAGAYLSPRTLLTSLGLLIFGTLLGAAGNIVGSL